MHYIENNMLSRTSLSQYINDMLNSYLSFSRNNREMIIFRETFDEINAAIKKNSIITFSSSSAEDKVFRVTPYMIAASKEEQCNYLLCADAEDRLLRTFRISRIKALFTTSDKFNPSEEIKKQLKEIALRNPQSASKNVKIRVRLTDRGIKKFKVVVKNRPDVERKDGNTYYFNWPNPITGSDGEYKNRYSVLLMSGAHQFLPSRQKKLLQCSQLFRLLTIFAKDSKLSALTMAIPCPSSPKTTN